MEAALVLCWVTSAAPLATMPLPFTATWEAVEATEVAAVSAVVEVAPAAPPWAVEVLSEQDELISVTSMAKETCTTVEAAAPESATVAEAVAAEIMNFFFRQEPLSRYEVLAREYKKSFLEALQLQRSPELLKSDMVCTYNQEADAPASTASLT